jgi:Permease MlaE/Mechanosensitive ion channel, beta-domain/Mechanosensitive ion channel, transmembrane helices 2/3
LLHYSILALGFVVGLGLLGMDLTRVTVLVGALGVGIGFGMQSVVNNFVSGLILLFERPLHVGDVVELGAVQGVVRRIGIRASVVHPWQGADVIVPNFQLVIAQVTNWPLTDQLRRIALPVGVNYGAVPQHVIALLETVAQARLSWLASIGTAVLAAWQGAGAMLGFIGEAVLACRRLVTGQARFRRLDLGLFVQECGVQALGIVTLISVLMGLILACMGAVQLRQFGAQIFVADLVGLGMTREMGCVLTGLILAGRTGAAFAAPRGTMYVNAEIDALQTMGIPPMEFLVLPRMLALMLMLPGCVPIFPIRLPAKHGVK